MPEPERWEVDMEDVEYIGFWVRLVAFIVDDIILAALFFLLSFIFGFSGQESHFWKITVHYRGGDDLAMTILFNVIFAALFLGYFVFLTGRYGATLGKMLLRIKVVGEDYNPISYGTAALREILGRIICAIFCYLGYIWVAFDKRKQGWHDKIAKTYVVSAA